MPLHQMARRSPPEGMQEGIAATARPGARRRVGFCTPAILAAIQLLSLCIYPTVRAQSAQPLRTPANNPARSEAGRSTRWEVLGRRELAGGNLAGAQASLEYAIALATREHSNATVASAEYVLGVLHASLVGLIESDVESATLFGGKADDSLTHALHRELDTAQRSYEHALALHQRLGDKDAVADDYAQLGELYRRAKDLQKAQGAFEKALTLNQALGRKEELVKSYESLSAIATARGDTRLAQQLHSQALALTPMRNPVEKAGAPAAKGGQDNDGGGLLLVNRGLGLYVSAASGTDQRLMLEKVFPQERAMGNLIGLATSYTLLGIHYGERAKTHASERMALEAKAEATLQKALALNKMLRREAAMAFDYRELALMRSRRGEIRPGRSDAQGRRGAGQEARGSDQHDGSVHVTRQRAVGRGRQDAGLHVLEGGRVGLSG